MALSDNDTPSLLATLSLLTATVCALLRPNGCKTFIDDVKLNILSFSPFRSGAIVTAMVLSLISYKLLNLADLHVALGLLARNYFPSELPDLRSGFWSRFARQAFLIGGTLPLYMMLLGSANHRWIQVLATVLVADAVQAEILTFYCRTSFEVRGGWPRRALLEKPVSSTDHPTQGHVENPSERIESGERKKHRHIPPSPVQRDNLCDRVHQLWPPAAEPDIHSIPYSFPLENAPKLGRILDPTIQARWTCGHWRCLVYMVLCVAVRAILMSWIFVEIASATWLLHCVLQPLTLQVAGTLLESNLLNGLLTMVYQLCTPLLLVLFAFVCSNLLFTRVFTRLSKQFYIIQRMEQKLHETAPITHKALTVLGKLCMPLMSSYYLTLALLLRIPWLTLTKEILSYIVEIMAIPTIYITVYWLVCSAARLEQAPPEPQSYPNTGQSLGPSVALDSNGQGTQNPAATDSISTHSYTTKKALGFRLAIFRLAILVPTAAVWIFLYR